MSPSVLQQVLRRERALLTPEGVPLRIELADPGERIAAFLIDFMISVVGSFFILFIGLGIATGDPDHFTLPLTLLVAFLVRNAYFLFFELHWAGVTPGKRMLGLRVIDRAGGPLQSHAIVARNLTRQAEFFFPIELLLMTHGWLWSIESILPVVLWLAAMCALLLTTRDRMRAGDLLAGTVVISIPKRMLLEDLAGPAQTFEFTDAQLEVYGILELQVLEDVLRGAQPSHLLEEIQAKIQKRIAWQPTVAAHDPRIFLRDFYTAQRAFLERRKNLGDERRDKFHGA